MDEIILVVPAVIGAVAVGAVAVSGEVPLVSLAPGLLAIALFAVGMYGLARYRSPGQPTYLTDADPYGAEGDAARAAREREAGTRTAASAVDGGTTDPTPTGAGTDGSGPTEPGTAFIRRADEVSYESVDAADGMRKGVLVDEADGAPNLAVRRFVLAPGASVPRHTNEIEHEQYVLEGTYTVGLGGEEYEVSAGDSLFIPAGVVHWYRNDGPDQGSFVCAVPTGDDTIKLV
jgi:quercetin dioxygenase-like cupin family protein